MATGSVTQLGSVTSVLVSRCLWEQSMLKCTLRFIVFQCENSLCSSYVGKCQCIWQLREAETFSSIVVDGSCQVYIYIYPLYHLVIQTQITSAFITTYLSFSSVFITTKTLYGTEKHHKSISISCLWNDEHDQSIWFDQYTPSNAFCCSLCCYCLQDEVPGPMHLWGIYPLASNWNSRWAKQPRMCHRD